MQGENKGFMVAKQKSQTTVERLCRFHTAPFLHFLEYVLSLSWGETPSYRLCQQLFEPLLEDASVRPLARDYQAASTPKVHSTPALVCPDTPFGSACNTAAGQVYCLRFY